MPLMETKSVDKKHHRNPIGVELHTDPYITSCNLEANLSQEERF
eukprot:CAMPEP_0197829684 /NCGR_PEP_ID=MMETSP1437-20131217/6218_1 /TAXON_ID=49252 ORGANISM="Eucampia antarctica, Strain CCMP1452" /NCGR_SAMPLE_ID=MMETSP1437 /ASSEMBLY_ACC=CAM_ASM_001096 /LENGTH=43 /DNA_ID= /DNA_START= /DNA_END= /DNA_ORIENTATION=